MNPCFVFKGTRSSCNLYKLNDKEVRSKIGKIKTSFVDSWPRDETMEQRNGLLLEAL